MLDATEQRRLDAHKLFSALPGYPFLPCPICVRDGFKGFACDHTVRERAQTAHPGLVLDVNGQGTRST